MGQTERRYYLTIRKGKKSAYFLRRKVGRKDRMRSPCKKKRKIVTGRGKCSNESERKRTEKGCKRRNRLLVMKRGNLRRSQKGKAPNMYLLKYAISAEGGRGVTGPLSPWRGKEKPEG